MSRCGRRAGAVALLVGFLAACGSSNSTPAGTSASTNSSSVPTDDSRIAGTSSVPIDDPRIVPLNGDVAEIVFALGLGDDVVATDLSATYPPDAAALPKFGFERALNAEPILEFEPTIAVGTDAAGPDDTLDELERVGVEVAIIERAFDRTGPAAKIRGVADALGVSGSGDELAQRVQAEIDDASVGADAYEAPMRVVALYLRGADLQFVLGDGSGIDWLIEAAGAEDVADELGVEVAAPITTEAILAAAPDAIIVPAEGLTSAGGVDALLAVPGIAETPAGRRGAILAYDDQLMLGNGPRTGAFLAQLVTDLRAIDAARPRPQD